MAENLNAGLYVNGERVAGRIPNWSELLPRIIGDVSRLMHAEMRLLEVNVRRAIAEEVNRLVNTLIAIVMLSLAGFCAVGAAILGLHSVLGLWWAAFAVVAGAGFLVGIGFLMLSRSRPTA